MLTYPNIDPVIWQITDAIAVRWYGVMYLIGFVGGWWLAVSRAKKPNSGWNPKEISDLLFYIALGIVIGGRVGYMVFYGYEQLLNNPLNLFALTQGGMSFHGGLLGVIVAMWLYGRKTKRRFFQVSDFVAPCVPIGLGMGRIGNFINGNLWGKPTDLPWGMVFPHVDQLPRHPSQLYQTLLEGLLLFVVLLVFSSKSRPIKAVSGLFALGYGVVRFLVEFVREPDAHIGYLAFGWLTLGQLLTLPLLVIGIVLFLQAYNKQNL